MTPNKQILPAAFIAHIQDPKHHCKRGSKTRLYQNLLRSLTIWRDEKADQTYLIPGYKTPPPNQPGHEFPAGWSIKHLMRHMGGNQSASMIRCGEQKLPPLEWVTTPFGDNDYLIHTAQTEQRTYSLSMHHGNRLQCTLSYSFLGKKLNRIGIYDSPSKAKEAADQHNNQNS